MEEKQGIKEVQIPILFYNTTKINHNLDFDFKKDKLDVIYKGKLLMPITHYTNTDDGMSIILTGWSVQKGELFTFKLFKNLKW